MANSMKTASGLCARAAGNCVLMPLCEFVPEMASLSSVTLPGYFPFSQAPIALNHGLLAVSLVPMAEIVRLWPLLSLGKMNA